jgi:hypothetical protein
MMLSQCATQIQEGLLRENILLVNKILEVYNNSMCLGKSIDTLMESNTKLNTLPIRLSSVLGIVPNSPMIMRRKVSWDEMSIKNTSNRDSPISQLCDYDSDIEYNIEVDTISTCNYPLKADVHSVDISSIKGNVQRSKSVDISSINNNKRMQRSNSMSMSNKYMYSDSDKTWSRCWGDIVSDEDSDNENLLLQEFIHNNV